MSIAAQGMSVSSNYRQLVARSLREATLGKPHPDRLLKVIGPPHAPARKPEPNNNGDYDDFKKRKTRH